MKKYSSNYSSINNNYIININMTTQRVRNESLYSTYNVLENILQRGNPTKPSKYLLESIRGYDINKEIRYISSEKQDWSLTIKGNEENNDNPARVFFEEILPEELKEDRYICNLIIPEAKIEEITNESSTEFYNSAVDFYLPQCKLVIEIDGAQHNNELDNKKDIERDQYLRKFDIKVLRIPVKHIKDYKSGNRNELIELVNKFKNYCKSNDQISRYKESLNIIGSNEFRSQLIFDGVMRFQIMLLQLLKGRIISIDDENWVFNIKNHDVNIPYEVAIEDVFLWLDDLLNLQGIKVDRPNIIVKEVDDLSNLNEGINIDFSLLKKYDDSVYEKNIIFIRSDYLDYRDYYKTATSELIRYSIIQEGDDDNIQSLYNLNENIFGFKTFNNGQLPIIINALSLNETIGLLPTGGGKSLCYQLCCLLQPTINFVVVPIKSLMYDQKINLDKKGIVHTNFIMGNQDAKEKDNILNEFGNGRYICVWISPERFQIETFRQQLRKINENYNIGYSVIDEVHCLSEWGHDFRTSYLNLAKTIRNLCPASVFLGLTATASKNVLNDVLVEFEMNESNVKTILDYTRKELKFNVIQDDKGANSDKEDNLLQLLTKLDNEDNVFDINGEESKSGLIFTPHVNGPYGCYGVSNRLNGYGKFRGKVKYYSGEVPKVNKKEVMDGKSFNEYKRKVQDSYQNNEFPLLIATKAFGMGIDKGNIRYTIHYGLSGSIESFYQEAGRAGRDKNPATCYILNSKDAIQKNDYDRIFSLDSSIDDLDQIVSKYRYNSGDILRNLFLSINSHKGVEMECKLACTIYQNYCINKKEIISVHNLANKLLIRHNNKTMNCDFGSVQKAIYRLSLLGVIEDWTIEDWGNRGKFKVKYGNIDYESIEKNLNKHINKYDVEFNTKNLNQPKYSKYYKAYSKPNANAIYKLIYILIQWNYDNVFYARRLSQKNLSDLCDAYFEKGEEYFKEVLEGYFKITDNSFVLDYLSNNPSDFESVFKVIFDEEENFKEPKELMSIKVSLTRFLESYRYNTALNYLSGILGLILNEYDDNLVKQRFNSALDAISNQNKSLRNLIFDNTLSIGTKLDENNKDNLSESLCRYIDKYKIYSILKDNVSLNYILEEKMTKLSKIGGRLHG